MRLIWLLPAALCSISIAVILKINERRRGDRMLIAGANYLSASVISLLILRGGLELPSAGTAILGSITGIVYVLGFLLLMAGISKGPLAVPVTIMRLSVAVPVAVSIFIWNEDPGIFQWIGLVAGGAAIILFGLGIRAPEGSRTAGPGFWLLMIAMFGVMGGGDVLLKAFREISPDSERLVFTSILFASASLFSWIVILIKRTPFDGRTFLLGLLLGLPNLFSTVFTLLALRGVSASLAFPFINLTVIFGSTLLAFSVWKEKLGRVATAGLIIAAAALVLLPL
jgi:drug/metabolite transporter (DMT)-like permease